jgi:uncharacterized membrane protein
MNFNRESVVKKIAGVILKLCHNVLLKKAVILKITSSIIALVLISFLIEYFVFGSHFNQYRFLLILSISSLLSFFVAFRKKIGERPEVGFLMVALICGSLLLFSEPKDYVSWDEQIHYKNSEKLASNVVPNMEFRPNTIESSYSYEEQKKLDVLVDGQYKKPKVKSTTISLAYDKLGYLPSAIAIAIGNLVHLPYHIVFNLGRWFNLLAYSLVVFLAIRKLKSGKMIMSVVALFPTAIFLASNYSYDPWLTAFTMLGLAYLFSELQQPEKKIATQEMVIMIGCFVIGLGPKAIYFPLMLLLYFMGRSKFDSLKKYKTYILATTFSILFVAGSFFLPFLLGGMNHSDNRGGQGVNSAQQIKFIVSQPLAYAGILKNFMKGYVNPLNAGGFVTFYAYLGMMKGLLLVLVMLALVTLTDKNEFDKQTKKWSLKLAVIGIYFSITVLISTALYVVFTPVGSPTINGVQPRYLIPLVFPLLFVIGSSKIKNPFNKSFYNALIFGIMAGVLLSGTWELIIRNYY